MSDRRIRISYQLIQPCDPEDDPEVESGWEDETGVSMELDRFDIEDGLTPVDKAVALLKENSVSEVSACPWSVGSWYTAYGEADYRTGERKNLSFHLYDFTPDEEYAIFCGVFPKKVEANRCWQVDFQRRERKQHHRLLAPSRPHGLCENSKQCVEHENDPDVTDCKVSKN